MNEWINEWMNEWKLIILKSLSFSDGKTACLIYMPRGVGVLVNAWLPQRVKAN